MSSSVGNDQILGGVNAVRGSNFGDILIGSNNPLGTIEFFEGLNGNDTINGDGIDILLVDINGGGAINPMAPGGYSGYEVAIQIEGFNGTLGNDDFLLA